MKDLETLGLKWDICIKSLPQSTGNPTEGVMERMEEPEEMEDFKKTKQSSYELTETDTACTGPTWVYTMASVLILWLLD